MGGYLWRQSPSGAMLVQVRAWLALPEPREARLIDQSELLCCLRNVVSVRLCGASAGAADDAEDGDGADESDDDDEAASESSEEEEEAEDAAPPRQMYFCCTDEKRLGGYFSCTLCRKYFHNACDAAAHAAATHSNGRTIKPMMCKQCHTHRVVVSSSGTLRYGIRPTQLFDVSHNVGGAGAELPRKNRVVGSRFEAFSRRKSRHSTALESSQRIDLESGAFGG